MKASIGVRTHLVCLTGGGVTLAIGWYAHGLAAAAETVAGATLAEAAPACSSARADTVTAMDKDVVNKAAMQSDFFIIFYLLWTLFCFSFAGSWY